MDLYRIAQIRPVIFFLQGQDLMGIPVAAGPSPGLGQPRKLPTWAPISRGFDVTGDGRRFTMIEETEPGAADAQITVVQNRAAEFSRSR